MANAFDWNKTRQLTIVQLLLAIFLPSAFAFVFYHSKSLWPSFAAHLVGNFVFSILGILMLMMGLAQ